MKTLIDGLEVRRTLKINIDQSLATKNGEKRRRPGTGTSGKAGQLFTRLVVIFAKFRGHRSPLALRNSTFLVRCSSVGPPNGGNDPTCAVRRGGGCRGHRAGSLAKLTRAGYLANITIVIGPTEDAMDEKQLAKYEVRAKIIKALAHPTRLMIVDELSQRGERCVCELTELVGSDMSTVYRQLAQLKQAGLLEDEKRGKMIFYRLRVQCLSNFFQCVESVVRANAETQQQLLRL
jgi:ArsR family transcriptional regulator